MQYFYLKKDTPKKEFHRHWQFCVGSGHAGLALRADYVRLLKECARDLGIKRVRFHGIFNDDMNTLHTLEDIFPIPVQTGIRERSFRLCALVYDNLLEAGVKPFVELSFMPEKMAREDVHGFFFYKPNICMPKDDREWTDYIGAFVRFLLERYGKEEVESWYFEVWNEPDLIQPFFNGTQEEYFHLYEITARTIKEIDPAIRVGGPATSGSKWIAAFLRFCRERQVPVDFVTTHQYAGDPLGGVSDEGGPGEAADAGSEASVEENMGTMFDTNRMAELVASAPKDSILPAYRRIMGDPLEKDGIPDNVFVTNAPIVRKQAGNLPLFYTEWNTCATFGAYTNDTRKVAAYDVKTALALEDVLDGSSIWCFCDIFEELHPFPEEFHGGFGLMSQSGIKKPVYYALQMLAQTGDERYELPGELDKEVSIAAFQGEGELQILLTRQKLQNKFDLPKETVSVEAELEKAPEMVILERIDGEHCNPLAVWEAMGSPQVPTPSQLAEIKEKSALREEEIPFVYKNGILKTQVSLGVNDVYDIRIVQ